MYSRTLKCRCNLKSRKILAVALIAIFVAVVYVRCPQVLGQSSPTFGILWEATASNVEEGIPQAVSYSGRGIISGSLELEIAVLHFGNGTGSVNIIDESNLPISISPQSYRVVDGQNATNTVLITNIGHLNETENGNLLLTLTDNNGNVVATQVEQFLLEPPTVLAQNSSSTGPALLFEGLLLSVSVVSVFFVADLLLHKQARKILSKQGFHQNRHAKFFLGLYALVAVFTFPFYATTMTLPQSWLGLSSVSVVFVISTMLLFKITIKKVELNYPLTSPTGKPDVYTGNEIPRPIYEDMRRYPWYFNKKKLQKKIKSKVKQRKQKPV